MSGEFQQQSVISPTAQMWLAPQKRNTQDINRESQFLTINLQKHQSKISYNGPIDYDENRESEFLAQLNIQKKKSDSESVSDEIDTSITHDLKIPGLRKSQQSASVKLGEIKEHTNSNNDSFAGSNCQIKRWSGRNTSTNLKVVKNDEKQKSKFFYEDDGLSHSFGSQNSIESEKKRKLTEILSRVLYIDGNLKMVYKFEDMIEEEIDHEEDPYPEFKEGIFFLQVRNWSAILCCRKNKISYKVVIYDIRSFYVFHADSRLRSIIVEITESYEFQTLTLIVICITTFCMIIYNYKDRGDGQVNLLNQLLDRINFYATIYYVIECILKLIAQGVFIHPNSYFRDGWNYLDFLVVLAGITELSPLPNIPVTGSRAFRVMRPLRSIRQFPSMRKLISGLVDSIPSLINALFFMLFVFLQFGIFGSQQFGGDYDLRCRFPDNVVNGEWQIDHTQQRLCSKDRFGYQCLSGTVCGQPKDLGLSSNFDLYTKVEQTSFIDYGITNMNNPLWSIFTIFQCITLEGWSTIMYNLSDAQFYLIPQVYFFVLIIIGAFFLLHVVLAIIGFSLSQSSSAKETSQNAQKIQISISLKRKQKQLKQEQLPKFYATLSLMTKSQEFDKESEKQIFTINQCFEFGNKDQRTVHPLQEPQLNTETGLQLGLQTYQSEQIAEPTTERKLLSGNQQFELMPNLSPKETGDPFKLLPTDLVQKQTVQSNSSQSESEDKNQEQSNEWVRKDKLQDNLNKGVSQQLLPPRVLNNRVYYFFYKICISSWFLLFWTLVITANTLIMTLDKFPQRQQFVTLLDQLNQAFSWAFTLEMLLKLLGFGFREYLRDKFTIFDATIVILCLVENVYLYVNGSSLTGGGLLALRSIRLLRVFKLARNWTSFRILLQKILDSINNIATFGVLLLIFLVVFIILGMQFFSGTVYINLNDQLVSESSQGIPPFNNFETLYNSTTTVFAVMMIDNWNVMMYEYFRVEGFYALIYFQLTLIVTNIILLNLFLALILELFENPTKIDDSDETELSGIEAAQRKFVYYLRLICKYLPFLDKKMKLSKKLLKLENYLFHQQEVVQNKDDEDAHYLQKQIGNLNVVHNLEQTQQLTWKRGEDVKVTEERKQIMSIAEIVRSETMSQIVRQRRKILQNLHGNSLYILKPSNYYRQFCLYIFNQKYFEDLSNIFVLLSTILLAVDNPLDDPESLKQKILGYLDIVMTSVFGFEAVIKISVFGFLLNGKKSYIRELWNVLDFFVVTISVLSYLPINAELSFYRAMRLLRIMRPLRMIQRNQGLKVAVKSLINVLPEVFSLAVISILTMGLLAVLGMNLYKGTFYSCNFSNIQFPQQEKVQTMWDCQDIGGEWVNSDQNFDNFFAAMTTIFQIMSLECWYTIFNSAQQSTQIFQTPAPNSQNSSFIYFVIVVMLQSVFIFNLFIGVVISTFNNEKEKVSNNTQLTELEREYIDICIKCYQVKPQKLFTAKGQCFRRICYQIVESVYFQTFVFIAIILNSIVLTITWYTEPQSVIRITDYINLALVGVYALEFLLKVCAFGHDYFQDGWNVLDFLIVILGILGYVLEYSIGENYTLAMTIIRAFRVVRLLKLVRRLTELRRICLTFLEAMPEIINIGGLLFLFLFIFVILGMNMFAGVKLQQSLDLRSNFQSFGVAFLTLFKASTGENWPLLMADLGRQRSIQFQCQESQSFQDIQLNGVQGCGNLLSYPFFVAFQIFVSFVMLNLFIAIILEGFRKELQQEQEKIQPETLEMYKNIWQKYDHNATGMIMFEDLENIILDLVVEELKIQNKTPIKLRRISDEILFNFRNKKLLKLCAFWRQKNDDGSPEYKNLLKSVFFQKQLQRHFYTFIGDLQIPTYNNLKNVFFYDVLISFVDFSFSQRHKKEYFDRRARIKSLIETKQVLSKLDRVQLYTPEYYKLARAERELLQEFETENFGNIIHSIEVKGKRTDMEIQKINQMQYLRRKLIFKNKDFLDHFGEEVMSTQYLVAARCIIRWIRQYKEKKKQLRQEKLNQLEQKYENKNRTPTVFQKPNALNGLISKKQQNPTVQKTSSKTVNPKLKTSDLNLTITPEKKTEKTFELQREKTGDLKLQNTNEKNLEFSADIDRKKTPDQTMVKLSESSRAVIPKIQITNLKQVLSESIESTQELQIQNELKQNYKFPVISVRSVSDSKKFQSASSFTSSDNKKNPLLSFTRKESDSSKSEWGGGKNRENLIIDQEGVNLPKNGALNSQNFKDKIEPKKQVNNQSFSLKKLGSPQVQFAQSSPKSSSFECDVKPPRILFGNSDRNSKDRSQPSTHKFKIDENQRMRASPNESDVARVVKKRRPTIASQIVNKKKVVALRPRSSSQIKIGPLKDYQVTVYGEPRRMIIKIKQVERRYSQAQLHREILRNIDSSPSKRLNL